METCNTCKFRDVNGGNEPCKSCVDEGGSVNNYQQAIDDTIHLLYDSVNLTIDELKKQEEHE